MTTGRAGAYPATAKADTLWRPDPDATYEPTMSAVEAVFYKDAQHNEPPVGMFHHTPTRPTVSPSQIHRFVTSTGERNDGHSTQAKRARRNGATRTHRRRRAPNPQIDNTRALVAAVLTEHGPLPIEQIHAHIGGEAVVTRRRLSTVLSDEIKAGRLEHPQRLGPWGLRGAFS